MIMPKGKYKNNETGQEVELMDFGIWLEGESKLIVIFRPIPYDIPQCCLVKTFKEKYVFVPPEVLIIREG